MKEEKALLVLKSLHTQMEQRQDKMYAQAIDTIVKAYYKMRDNKNGSIKNDNWRRKKLDNI